MIASRGNCILKENLRVRFMLKSSEFTLVVPFVNPENRLHEEAASERWLLSPLRQ